MQAAAVLTCNSNAMSNVATSNRSFQNGESFGKVLNEEYNLPSLDSCIFGYIKYCKSVRTKKCTMEFSYVKWD